MPRWWLLLALVGCKAGKDGEEARNPILDVEETAAWTVPGMTGTAQVLTDAYGVPWVYAENRGDLGRALGFVLARDRYFYMDLGRRYAQGSVSELLGDAALDTDLTNRLSGMTAITDHLVVLLDADPEMKAYFEGFAEGINAYVEQVRAERLPAPTEYETAHLLLGRPAAIDLMAPFTLRDVAAGMVTVLYESGFETKDVGRAADAARLATAFDGAPQQALRAAAAVGDHWDRAAPPVPYATVEDWSAPSPARATRPPAPSPVPPAVLERLRRPLERMERQLGHDWEHGFGSNAWAVDAAHSADGRALVATDGHLSLTLPPLFYQVGIDTRLLSGDGDGIRQVGMMTPAMPLISTGTNGDVAFGQTQLMGDITDWYAEELVLDGAGAPAATRFRGEDKPLRAVPESIAIGAVPLLGSTARTLSFTRYEVFDGRWIAEIEGREVDGPEDAGDGETAVLLQSGWVVPGDLDDDGVISAVSFDYAGFDLSNMARVIDTYGRARDVASFAEATEDLVAYSLNLVAADSAGDIFYTSFQATPCRSQLPRNPDGTWVEGADPNLLLDGTQYGGFTLPLDASGLVDFDAAAADRCVIPWDEVPHAFGAARGFLVSGNNDPGGYSLDDRISDDPRYLGGPWIEGFRAEQIDRRLAAGGTSLDLDAMKSIQGDHTSVIGRWLQPVLDEALVAAAAADEDAEGAEGRMAELWADHGARLTEARDRLRAWATRGFQAASGVETFYGSPAGDDLADAVATMIFNAWMGRYVGATVGDEGIPGLGWPTGDTGRFRLLRHMLDGRGGDNPLGLAGWDEATGDHVYFDDRRTDARETADEVAVAALVDALDFLTAPPTGPGEGGFGTADMDAWLWGLRHWVRFDSLLADFLGADDPLLSPLIEPLRITPSRFPVAEGLTPEDPRADLPGFPRHGDHLNVDAGNSGTSGTRFSYGSGPVWRLVVALGGDAGFEAYNVLPGGQSGITTSPHFDDQAKLWLGNDVIPVFLDPADVAGNAVAREVFSAP